MWVDKHNRALGRRFFPESQRKCIEKSDNPSMMVQGIGWSGLDKNRYSYENREVGATGSRRNRERMDLLNKCFKKNIRVWAVLNGWIDVNAEQ